VRGVSKAACYGGCGFRGWGGRVLVTMPSQESGLILVLLLLLGLGCSSPCHRRHGLRVLDKVADEEAGCGVPEAHHEVVSARQQPLVVGAPRHKRHAICLHPRTKAGTRWGKTRHHVT